MAGVAIEFQLSELANVEQAIHKVTGMDRFELLDSVGRMVQLQTRRRIMTEKTAPDGSAWTPNRRKTPTLYASGALHDSIDYIVGAGQITVGSPLPNARIHQLGGEIKPKNGEALSFMAGNERITVKSVTMPARPYIGISTDNAREIEAVVNDFVAEVVK